MKPPFQDKCLGQLAPTLRTTIVPDGVKPLVYFSQDVGTYVDLVFAFKPGRAFVVSAPDCFLRFTMDGGRTQIVLTHEHGSERIVMPREVTKVEAMFTTAKDDIDFSAWIEDLSTFAHASARAGGEAV